MLNDGYNQRKREIQGEQQGKQNSNLIIGQEKGKARNS